MLRRIKSVALLLELTPSEERELVTTAARAGVSVRDYLLNHALPSRASADDTPVLKPYRALQFSGSAPRPLEQVEAHVAEVEASRDEWDDHDIRALVL
jgi:hypothetical protein